MLTETTISAAAVNEVLALIHEYLAEGGTGFNADLLSDALAALGGADRLVIASE